MGDWGKLETETRHKYCSACQTERYFIHLALIDKLGISRTLVHARKEEETSFADQDAMGATLASAFRLSKTSTADRLRAYTAQCNGVSPARKHACVHNARARASGRRTHQVKVATKRCELLCIQDWLVEWENEKRRSWCCT